ncbi:hypothetical protein J8TS2_27980 [Lederbergia ruris]|uniref:Uncharacterized protein n=1 Tax=Lederbergia ruris TaxID=217495 RepID=A0ABQ4KMU0_9BACI|nr:hypothetical protein [Lederbergia ruris]GIN58479.1 hypothetical protein J8TS2_27980 [Lederbergia ruris]
MKVKNIGNQSINIQATYDEISKIVNVLDQYWLINNDEAIKQLAQELRNPKVVVKKEDIDSANTRQSTKINSSN